MFLHVLCLQFLHISYRKARHNLATGKYIFISISSFGQIQIILMNFPSLCFAMTLVQVRSWFIHRQKDSLGIVNVSVPRISPETSMVLKGIIILYCTNPLQPTTTMSKPQSINPNIMVEFFLCQEYHPRLQWCFKVSLFFTAQILYRLQQHCQRLKALVSQSQHYGKIMNRLQL